MYYPENKMAFGILIFFFYWYSEKVLQYLSFLNTKGH